MLYELTMFQTYYNQLCLNRWNYLSSGSIPGMTGALALLNAIGANVDQSPPVDGTLFGEVLTCQHDTTATTGWSARAIYDVTDFVDIAYNPSVMGGITSGDAMSPAAAWGFRTNRVRQDIARGAKRFVGVSDEYVTDGGVVGGAMVGNLVALGEIMSDVLSHVVGADSVSFTPVIVKKQPYTTPSGKTAYRYYSTLVAQEAQLAELPTWQAWAVTRTQRSRQYGHGA